MCTYNYKGHYIHENFDTNIVEVQFMHDKTWTLYKVKSYRAAQLKITKLIKEGY